MSQLASTLECSALNWRIVSYSNIWKFSPRKICHNYSSRRLLCIVKHPLTENDKRNSLIHLNLTVLSDSFQSDATNANHLPENRQKRSLFGARFCCREISLSKPSALEQKILEIPYGERWRCLFKSFNTVAAVSTTIRIPFFSIAGRKELQINSAT